MDTQLKEPERETFVEAVAENGRQERGRGADDRHAGSSRRSGRRPLRRPLPDREQPGPSRRLGPEAARRAVHAASSRRFRPHASGRCKSRSRRLHATARRAPCTGPTPRSRKRFWTISARPATGGFLIDPQYGGVGAPFAAFSRFLMRMATIEPNVAGLASVHGCIGAVDPLRTFGTPEQKERYLPKLASGERLSAFALTEPCAGSDLTALRTTARLDGDDYVVDGEKLFITNAVPGRTIGLVCRIEESAIGLDRRFARPRKRSVQARDIRSFRAQATA